MVIIEDNFLAAFSINDLSGLRWFDSIPGSEQDLCISTEQWEKVTININAPLHFRQTGKTYLVFYALPNGNSIQWKKGKKMIEGDDWHFDIQHIAAQTRYVRAPDKNNNCIIVYLLADQKSRPTWKRSTPASIPLIKKMVDSISNSFRNYAHQSFERP